MISVAIDGPAGVGKSTISKLLAKKLGWHCLDTGALYRAFTVECINQKIDMQNENAVLNALPKISISVTYIDGVQHTFVNNKDYTTFLRSEIVDKNVAYISKYKKVRENIVKVQREIATKENVVCEGRDITSVVLKETKNKFYLTATAEERANRRYKERISRGEKVDYNEILEDIKKRDKIDSERENSPLKLTEESILIDSTNLTIEQVVETIYLKCKLK